MVVHVDVDTQLDRNSINQSAAEIKREMEQRGDSAGRGFTEGFAKAVERDTKVRAAAEKIGDSLDKLTAAEARRATELAKSKAVNEAVAASEVKLNKQRSMGFDASAAETERELTALREKQVEVNNRLVISTAAVSRAERDRTRSIREAGDAYRKMGDDGESAMGRLHKLADLPGGGGAIKWNVGLIGIGLLPAAATAITEVAGAVQQLAGAGLALPGIFAGIASSVGVGALGMHGMSDALDKISKADLTGTQASVDAANKALANLSPTGADVVKTVAGLKGTFTDLRNIASENMFDGFSGGLKGLVGNLLPAATRGIDGISRGINQNLLQAMTSLGSGSSQGFLDRIFGNTASAQSKLTAAIDPIVHAVGTLTAAGSDTLPRLADAVGKVADRFDAFITSADGDGRLKKWIDEGLDGFTSLGNTALNIGKTFTALTQAAGGGAGLLGTLESATGKLQIFLNSTEGQSKLKDYFAQGRDMLGQLKDVAVSAGPILAGVFNAGVSAANAYLPVIEKILDLINQMPGGVEAVVNAFIAWKTISGVGDLAKSLTAISNLLRVAIPGAAAEGAGGITAAIAGISLPGWMTAILGVAGGAAALVSIVGGYAFVGNEVFKDAPNSPENARARGAAGLAGGAPGVRPTDSPDPLSGGGVGPHGRGSGTGLAPTPQSMWGIALPPAGPLPGMAGSGGLTIPGVSSYSPPVVTEGGSGTSKTPFIDPSKYMMGDPLTGMPAAVAGSDPSAIYDADSKVITATHNLEQGRLALQVLEAKGNATQQELLTAKNNLVEQERSLYDAQAGDIKARTNQMKQATTDLQSVFAPLDQDFGISKGLPGLVENLVKMFGNMALAGAIGSSPQLQGAALSLMTPQTQQSGVAGSNAANNAAIGQAFFGPGVPSPSQMGPAAWQPVAAGAQQSSNGVPAAGQRTGGNYGLPGGTNSGGYGGGGAQFPAWVNQLAAAFDVKPSTYPGHQESDRHEAGYAPNPNHENRGIDWSGSVANMQKFADYVASTGPEQVIWQNPNTGAADTVAGGRSVSGYYDAGTLAEHQNHVHTRQSSPIPLPGMAGAAPATGGGTGWFPPGTGLPSVAPGGGYGITGGPGQSGGPGFGPTMAQGPGVGGAAGQQSGLKSFAPAASAGGAGGGAAIGGGALGMAEDAGAMALDVMAPGAGEGAKIGIQLAKRTIQYGAQAAAIGISGLMDTFQPHGSELAGKSWFSKIASGVSGARPATPNMAAKQAPPLRQDQGQPGQGQGSGPPPGPTNGVYIENMNNHGPDGQGVASDIDRMQLASRSAGGPR